MTCIQCQYVPLASTNTASYLWGLDLSGTPQGAGGVGGLLAVLGTPNTSSASIYTPIYDANGNVTEYVDSSGATVAHYAYDAYGNTIAQSGLLADEFKFRFSTKHLDTETGNYYYGRRYYAPYFGRFISQDPIGEQGGLNLYGFCGNDPINRWDYLGMLTGIPEPSPIFSFPYSTAKEKYTLVPGTLIERHFRHCRTEGNMDRDNYQKHFDAVVLMTWRMATQSIRKQIGVDIYDTMAKLALSEDNSKLYGVNLIIKAAINKSGVKIFGWEIQVEFKDIETCGCNCERKNCGQVKKIKNPEKASVFEYQEKVP